MASTHSRPDQHGPQRGYRSRRRHQRTRLQTLREKPTWWPRALVLAGTEAFVEVFAQVDDASEVEFTAAEGDQLTEGQSFANITGLTRSILSSERVALNILQHMCGIATHARRCAEAVKPHAAKVVDTRKTLPGLRALEKYAVRVGGGHNHRFGLFDGVLIKTITSLQWEASQSDQCSPKISPSFDENRMRGHQHPRVQRSARGRR